MRRDDVIEDDALRLVDVLLEEELAAPAAPASSRRARWLAAAAILFGLSVVAGVRWLHGHDKEVVPASQHQEQQQPQPDPAVHQAFLNGLREPGARAEAFARVKRLRVEPMSLPHGFVVARAGLVVTDLARVRRVADEVAALIGNKKIQALFGWSASQPPPAWTCALHLELEGGEDIDFRALLGSEPFLISHLLLAERVDEGALLNDLRELYAGAMQACACGVAQTTEELRALPAATRSVLCGPLTADEVRKELTPFAPLERLAIAPIGERTAVSPDAVAAIAGLGTLRSLALPADGLGTADLAGLARLSLRELELTGRLRLPGRATLAELRELAVLRLDLSGCEGDLRGLLASLPSLTVLELGDGSWLDDGVIDAILATKVVRLSIGGEHVQAPQLERLASLPSLRELQLHDVIPLFAGEQRALGNMQRLRRLELVRCDPVRGERGGPIDESQPPDHDYRDLRAKLPGCIVENLGSGTRWWPDFEHTFQKR